MLSYITSGLFNEISLLKFSLAVSMSVFQRSIISHMLAAGFHCRFSRFMQAIILAYILNEYCYPSVVHIMYNHYLYSNVRRITFYKISYRSQQGFVVDPHVLCKLIYRPIRLLRTVDLLLVYTQRSLCRLKSFLHMWALFTIFDECPLPSATIHTHSK